MASDESLDSPEDELRARLFAAAVEQDSTFEELAIEHEETIFRVFHEWQVIPEELRDDGPLTRAYVHGLISIATYFAEEHQKTGLIELLTEGSEDENNPLQSWKDALNQAHQLKLELSFNEAIQLLNDHLIDSRHLKGSGVEFYRPVTLGFLGDLYFQEGKADQALATTKSALSICRENDDEEGIRTYLTNLYEMERYRGNHLEAAQYAQELADALVEGGEKNWFQSQATVVGDGEPLNRVVVENDGFNSELKDNLAKGQLRFVFQRNRPSLFACDYWTQVGAEFGRNSKLEEALDAFDRAASIDAFDPQPHYQAGFVLLYLERYYEAAARFERCDELAPGWFHCRANSWLATEMARGKLPQHILMLILQHVDDIADDESLLKKIEDAIEEAPQVALLYLMAARAYTKKDEYSEARSILKKGLDFAQEDDARTQLLLDLAIRSDEPEKQALLLEASNLNGNLIAAATATLLLQGFDET
ncbi:MAG: hypothetical protein P1V97_36030 [Planctomycetota bacterium]|nr:hypothetical protein [Planctomycetota bacterium]